MSLCSAQRLNRADGLHDVRVKVSVICGRGSGSHGDHLHGVQHPAAVSRDDVPLPVGWPCDQRGHLGYGSVGLRLPGFTRSERLHQAQQNQRLHCFQDSDVWSGPVLLPGAAGCRRLLYGQRHRSGSGSSVSLQLVLRSHLGCPPEARPQQTRRVPVQPVDVVGDLLEAGVGGGVERGSVQHDGDLQRSAGRPLRAEHPELPAGVGCGPGDPAMTRSLQIQNEEVRVFTANNIRPFKIKAQMHFT